MLRGGVTLLAVFLEFVVYGPLIVLASMLGRHDAVRRLVRSFLRLMLWLSGVKTRHSFDAPLPTGGAIYVANHESHYDAPALLGHHPHYLNAVAKRELFDLPVFGPVFRMAGFIQVDRHRPSRAQQGMAQGVQAVRDGASALIFPEGTRSPDGSLRPFKKGAVIMAIQAQVPLVPVAIAGTYDIMSSSTFLVRPGPIHIIVGEPLSTQGLTFADRDDLNQRLRSAVESLRERARAQLRQE